MVRPPTQTTEHIHMLELRAVFMALRYFFSIEENVQHTLEYEKMDCTSSSVG